MIVLRVAAGMAKAVQNQLFVRMTEAISTLASTFVINSVVDSALLLALPLPRRLRATTLLPTNPPLPEGLALRAQRRKWTEPTASGSAQGRGLRWTSSRHGRHWHCNAVDRTTGLRTLAVNFPLNIFCVAVN